MMTLEENQEKREYRLKGVKLKLVELLCELRVGTYHPNAGTCIKGTQFHTK